MRYRIKDLLLLGTVFLSFIRFVLLTIFIIAVLALILLGLFQVSYILGHWNGADWQESLSMIVISVVVLVCTPMKVLRLFDDHPSAKRAAGWYRQRLHVLLEFILAPITAHGVLAFFVSVLAIDWTLLLHISGQTVINTTASWFLIGALALLAFTLFGQGATSRMLRWIIGPRLRLPWLTSLLRPSLMRVYVYAFLALAYLLSTLENFSGVEMINRMWWETFRLIIVEMLLTYVAIDGAFVAWCDHREAVATVQPAVNL